jgi:predicted NBD/HSP70 family sugar kinase
MVLSIDIGGSFIRIADISGKRIRDLKVVRTPDKKKRIIEKIEELVNEFTKRDLICISVAGFVKDGKIIASPNLDLNNYEIKKELGKRLGARIYVQNDAKCAAIAENHYGVGQKYKNFVYVTIGTGIGGAIFIDNNLYTGNSFAGEFGHMIFSNEEFEKTSSGKAFHKLLMKKGRRESFKILEKNLAKGILNICYALDPEAVIIGGGFGTGGIDISQIKKNIKKIDIIRRKIKIEKSELDGHDSLIGAAMLSKINF